MMEYRDQKTQEGVSEREFQWKKMLEEVEVISDRIGKKIDEGIKETVAAFLAHGFPTSQSCEGHIGEEGTCYPWIEIETPELEGWEEDEQKKRTWILENLKHQQRLLGLLDEFYSHRNVPFDVRLTFRYIGAYGAFRVQSIGADIAQELLNLQEQQEKVPSFKKEMDDFTTFLKTKYLGTVSQ